MKTHPRSLSCRLALLLYVLIPAVMHAAAPVNDTFEKATVLSGRLVTLTNQNGTGATANALDPYVGAPVGAKPAKSLWYRFDATLATPFAKLTITDNTATGMRAGVFILKDPDGGAGSLVSVAQMMVTGGLDVDTLTFEMIRGFRYYIVIDAPGTVNLRLKIPGPQNDFFEDAAVLAGNEGTVNATNLDACDDNDQAPANTYLGRGVWYRWTPTTSVPVVVDTTFSEVAKGRVHDTYLSVYTGSALDNLALLVDNDDGAGQPPDFGFNSRVTFNTVAGTTYYIWLGTFGGNANGPVILSYYPATSAGEFVLAAPEAAGERQGKVTVPVRRLRAGAAANVTLSTFASTATAGVDYTTLTGSMNFAAGVAYNASAIVTLLPDNLVEGDEQFGVILTAPTGGAVIGTPATSFISIRDEQQVLPPEFAMSSIRVNERDGVVQIPLQRSTGISSATEVHFSRSGASDTAREGVDYQLPDDIVFEPGQSFCNVPLLILNNGTFTGTRVFYLVASTPGFNYNYISVTIEDDDLVAPVAGRLAATLDEGGIAGGVDITVSATGAVTGKVTMARGVFAFTGRLDAKGALTVRLGPATGPLRTLQLKLENASTKTYSIVLNDAELGSAVLSMVTATNFTALTPCPVAGKYTAYDNGVTGIPLLSAGLYTVSPLGSATYSGKLFDGTPFVASGAADSTGYIRVASSLYAGKGRLLVNGPLSATAGVKTFGVLYLLRPGRANQSVELPALDEITNTNVARYVAPPAGQRMLPVWSAGTGLAELTSGGFPAMVTKPITISTANKLLVTTLLPEKLTLTLTPATGMFTGMIIPTGATTPKTVYGYVLQVGATSDGKGFFVNGASVGQVRLKGP